MNFHPFKNPFTEFIFPQNCNLPVKTNSTFCFFFRLYKSKISTTQLAVGVEIELK